MLCRTKNIEKRIKARIEYLKSLPGNVGYEWVQNETDSALKELYALLVWIHGEDE